MNTDILNYSTPNPDSLMPHPTSLMLDIETLATPEDLAPGQLVEVVEIAAVIFDPVTGHPRDAFHCYPAPNGAITHDTALWWIRQAAKSGRVPSWVTARKNEEDAFLADLLPDLLSFIDYHQPTEFWSKGTFDYPILQAHLGHHQHHTPWLYHQTRDLRTVLKTFQPCKPPPAATPTHNALEDCHLQIRQLTEILQTLRKAS